MRLAVDTGGTFTDLVVESEDGSLAVHKRPTTPSDPILGILDVLGAAADAAGSELASFLSSSEVLIHATTHAINALLTGQTARTAFLTTAGHPDVLLLREGGRAHFNVREPFPAPYVPRSLTFEVPERIAADGSVVRPLDERRVEELAAELETRQVEAVAVCLLWSVVDPVHELAVERILSERLPGIPVTLSHRLASSLREYRRASAAAIDASLRPMMARYLSGLDERLRLAGFGGRLLMVSSSGALLDAAEAAAAPIHVLKSGPAMQPVAGRHVTTSELGRRTAIVADTGGTSYDVSVVRDGLIPWTRETWVGERFLGHMVGFPSVDVRSYGAGGGSVAWVDAGGLLHVGPQSAGADPGPAAYGRGGTRPTFTDAAVVLGWIDPDDFLGGLIMLDAEAARSALEREVGRPLGLDAVGAAAAVFEVITEQMTRVVEETTLQHGVDPREAVLVGGGGAAGLNIVGIARRLGCTRALVPETSAALSAAGALVSDLGKDFTVTCPTRSSSFAFADVAAALAGLQERARNFLVEMGGSEPSGIDLFVEAHYAREVWEIEVPVLAPPRTGEDVEALRQAFHALHEELYAVSDDGAEIEFISWRARAWRRLPHRTAAAVSLPGNGQRLSGSSMRSAFFPGWGWLDVAVRELGSLRPGEELAGPVIVSSSVTTMVIEPGAVAARTRAGGLQIRFERAA